MRNYYKIGLYWTLPLLFLPIIVLSSVLFIVVPISILSNFFYEADAFVAIIFTTLPGGLLFITFSYPYLLAARLSRVLKWIVVAIMVFVHFGLLYDQFKYPNFSLDSLSILVLFCCGYWVPFFIVANKLAHKLKRAA